MRKSLKDAAAEQEQLKPLLEKDRKIARLEQRTKELQTKYNRAIAELDSSQAREEFLSEVSGPREWETWSREIKRQKSVASVVVLASDWHVGESVDPATVNGKNEYNPAIAERRIRKFFEKIPEYVDRYAPMAKEMVLWVGGDMITGYLHEEQLEGNSMSPAEECLFFRDHFNAGLSMLLREFKGRITLPTSFGNHGRTTVKMRAATGAFNSFEWLTYKVMAHDWRNESRVKWKVEEGYHNFYEVHGKLYRFSHGDAVKYGGGIGGVHVPLRRVIGEWNKTQRADVDCLGHFHTSVWGGYYSINGTMMGTTAYGMRRFGHEAPSQTFLVVDGKHGVRQMTQIFVDDQ